MKNETNEMTGLYKKEETLLRVLDVNEDEDKSLLPLDFYQSVVYR